LVLGAGEASLTAFVLDDVPPVLFRDVLEEGRVQTELQGLPDVLWLVLCWLLLLLVLLSWRLLAFPFLLLFFLQARPVLDGLLLLFLLIRLGVRLGVWLDVCLRLGWWHVEQHRTQIPSLQVDWLLEKWL